MLSRAASEVGDKAHAATGRSQANAHWSVFALVGLLLTVSESAHAAVTSVEQCLAASDASLTLENESKLIATRDALHTCAAASCPDEIRSECLRRIAIVEQKLPSVVCDVRDAHGNPLGDVRVSIDGAQPLVLSNAAIELDPGTHLFVVESAGKPTVTRRVEIKSAAKNQLVTLEFEAAPAPLPANAASGGVAVSGATRAPKALPARRVVALATGGVGLAALAVAGVFAVIALDRKSDANADCPNNPCSTAQGAERWQSAWRAGNASTAFSIGGGVALAAAAALWFSVHDESVSVAIGPTQLQLGARF